MKKLLFPAIVLACFSFNSAAQVRMPAPSPTQTIKQEFGIGSVEITYSRPAAKGRKIFGDLVPYNKLWRTGANAATRIVLTEPLEFAGKRIDTGTYVLYSIPGIDSWDIIFNKGLTNWGIDGYKEAQDVARIRVEPVKSKTKVESFTIQFVDVKPESCEMQLLWEKTVVAIPVKTDFRDKVRAQIEAALQTDKKPPYWQAAQFYNEYEKNLPKALENVTKAIETNDKAYWMWIYKAKIQKDLGDNAGAMESSKKSLALAKEARNDDYVKINEDFQKTLK